MDNDSIELLKEINNGCKMGLGSMEQVQKFIHEDELQKLVGNYKKKHEEMEAESTKLLLECGETESDPGVVVTTFSWFTTEMKLMIKDDSHQIAKLMMDGCSMGIQSISKVQNECVEASKEARNLGDKLIKTDEEFMMELKSFL